MFQARPFATLLIAGAFFTFPLSAQTLAAQDLSGSCEKAGEISVLPSPAAPWKGAPLRVIIAAEKPSGGELSLIAPNGRVAAKSSKRYGGPPYFWYAEVASPAAGKWQARLVRGGDVDGCKTVTREIAVDRRKPPRRGSEAGSVWPLRNSWNRGTENLYSAWIEKLFDAPPGASLSWPVLHEVLRDRSRNMLHNYLGLGEDSMGMTIRPDCADLPYFLRAYFAFKMGLPFGYSKCTRGGKGRPPRCVSWLNVQSPQEPPSPPAPAPQNTSGSGIFMQMLNEPAPPPVRAPAPKRLSLAAAFGRYLRTIGDGVHSGSARTASDDENNDHYPVPLRQDTLRPGTIYADPYGHILMLAKRIPQTAGSAGVFLAIDGQPDGTVARKRFWRGNFLFAKNPALGGPGFKRFRPIVAGKNGGLRRLSNAEIAANPDYGDFSLEQSRLGIEEFYDRMDDVMSPEPLDPLSAMKEAIASLEEQVKARVTSVENGRKYQNSGRGDADMPDGPSIFETAGAWEDYATPSRDLRLLIAIDVVHGFPARVERRPGRFAMPKDKSPSEVKAGLQNALDSELAAHKFSYKRSDGSAWTLSLKDVVDRAVELEMAYNLNDCVELRWGAPEGSQEAATCKRHAPAVQRAKMRSYRDWFHERRRPPRA